jgi:hypothetical protein
VQVPSVVIRAVLRNQQVELAVRVAAWQAKFLQVSVGSGSVFQQEDLETSETHEGPRRGYMEFFNST